ncbi:hypothetical protein [Allonocardiopsis opalescens]|uniref:Uncharacterized protein n=1 Tax=Allonocardiopsis opalescens TaxID=1144618 RepID=A0A2T0Q9G6_9ACTN|nr:hypothetical protein [Allonocardiopsis opalescens]PRY00450.1 hypothetical protein CLV72_10281 [Allonocardiopsis opalescens]
MTSSEYSPHKPGTARRPPLFIRIVTDRRRLRAAHLLLSLGLGVHVYGPWTDEPALRALTQFGLFPAIALVGVLLWQAPRVRRLATR